MARASNGRIGKSTPTTQPGPARRMSERQRSRLVAEASSSKSARAGASTSSDSILQNMMNQAAPVARHDSLTTRYSITSQRDYFSPPDQARMSHDEAPSFAIDPSMALGQDFDVEMMRSGVGEVEDSPIMRSASKTLCPITDKDEIPFPLMKLPPEIRNEIYRACLTRPFNILLSRQEPVPTVHKGKAKAEEDTRAQPQSIEISSDSADSSQDESAQTQLRKPLLDAWQRDTEPATASNATAERPVGFNFRLNKRSPALARRRAQPRRTAPMLPSSTSLPAALPWSAGTPVTYDSNENINVLPRIAGNTTAAQAWRAPMRIRYGTPPRDMRPQDEDPLVVSILGVSKMVYNEARSILYSENHFTLDLETALSTLQLLHQRSRRQIKHVEIEIPCYNEILERFQETVRLSLRYCWGLKTLVIHMPFILPGTDGSGTSGNTTVYANGFDILRWLPRACEVVLKGNVSTEIEAVVRKNATLAKTLDEVPFLLAVNSLSSLLTRCIM
ncbi:Hypothetical protein R9X50_00180500 [Acrodontium crateriforme]|uniref:Uncharacterized protein n=1 Tax=Acrodontium crateriforme TaxID=150365 RepID=A0AAQ3M036_9PEZI|nr:Hypothetical protein R9X50_00180500 [Acrodontium crateriforme]